MYKVRTNDDNQRFTDLLDAEAYAQSKPFALVLDENNNPLCGYINGERLEKEQVHAYPMTDVLRPNGSMEKGSLSYHLYKLFERMMGSWTDNEQFADAVSKEDACESLMMNAFDELNIAVVHLRENLQTTKFDSKVGDAINDLFKKED